MCECDFSSNELKTCMYSFIMVSSSVPTLHTAKSLTPVKSWDSFTGVTYTTHETLQFQYCNHVGDGSVQCANGTINPETTVATVGITAVSLLGPFVAENVCYVYICTYMCGLAVSDVWCVCAL